MLLVNNPIPLTDLHQNLSLIHISLKVPEEVPGPNRIVDEEGEEKEEKRNNFCGLIQDDKKTSVNTELQDSERTSWLNPEAAEFVPVLFMRDPDPVTSSSSTQGYEKSLESVALPSPVEINFVIAHEPGRLDSRVENVEDVLVAESGYCLLYTSRCV